MPYIFPKQHLLPPTNPLNIAYSRMIIRGKQDYYIDMIKAAENNTKNLFEISYYLFGCAITRILLDITIPSM